MKYLCLVHFEERKLSAMSKSIDAKDLNDAIQAAAKIPLARLGTIEVRPVQDLE
jgi:hypothetical protein